jgi:hypothetical protein
MHARARRGPRYVLLAKTRVRDQQRLVIDAAACALVEAGESANRIPGTQERSAKSREWPVAKLVA